VSGPDEAEGGWNGTVQSSRCTVKYPQWHRNQATGQQRYFALDLQGSARRSVGLSTGQDSLSVDANCSLQLTVIVFSPVHIF
jgi:hypothetical protein